MEAIAERLPDYLYITKHLRRRFRHSREYTTTVLLAPDGFGKTTAICWYLSEQQSSSVWVDFSRGEEEAWRQLVHELFEGRKMGKLFEQPFQLSFEGKYALFQAVLRKSEARRAAIVLENYGSGRSRRSDRFVEYLMENLPDNWHILVEDSGALRSRAHQWMGERKVQVLDVEDLKFHVEDICRYFHQNQVRASIEELMGLFEISKGSVGEIRKILLTQVGMDRDTASLTAREREIAAFAADGLTNRQIAERLFISENTVKSALKSIFDKLDIHSRRSLIHLFNRKEIPLE